MSGCPVLLAMPRLPTFALPGLCSQGWLLLSGWAAPDAALNVARSSGRLRPEPAPGWPTCTRGPFRWRAAAGFRAGNSASGAEAALPIPEEGSAVSFLSRVGTAFVTRERTARPSSRKLTCRSAAAQREARSSPLQRLVRRHARFFLTWEHFSAPRAV